MLLKMHVWCAPNSVVKHNKNIPVYSFCVPYDCVYLVGLYMTTSLLVNMMSVYKADSKYDLLWNVKDRESR